MKLPSVPVVGGRTLAVAGLLSFGVALLHLVMIFVGAPAYRFFTAGERMVRLAEAGSPVPALVTLALAVVFAAFALYGLSGAGLIRRLPLLPIGLGGIAAIYTVRGLPLIPQLVGRVDPPRSLVFSAVSLVIGLVYLAGVILSWNALKR